MPTEIASPRDHDAAPDPGWRSWPVHDAAEFPNPTTLRRIYNRIAFHLNGGRYPAYEPFVGELELDGVRCRFLLPTRAMALCVVGFSGEQDYLRMMMNAIRPDDVFWDIGGFIGLVSAFAAKKNPSGTVAIVEPDPALASRLEQNLDLNEIKNGRLFRCALGDRKDTLRLNTSGEAGGAPSLFDRGLGDYVEVPVERLDDLVASSGLQPNVIKIDVEGFENRVLLGGERTFDDPRLRAVFLELHPTVMLQNGERFTAPIEFLEQRNFAMTWCPSKKQEMMLAFERKA